MTSDKRHGFARLKRVLWMSDKSANEILGLTESKVQQKKKPTTITTTTFSFQELKKVEKKNVTVHKFNLFPTCPQG